MYKYIKKLKKNNCIRRLLRRLLRQMNNVRKYNTIQYFEDFSKFDVYDKNNGNIDKTVIKDNKDNNGDDVEHYTYTIVSTNENYVFKVSLYSHT